MDKFLIFIFLLTINTTTTIAQGKYGHLNFGNVVALMPDTQAADSELEAYQKQLVTKGEEMAKAFQTNYQQLMVDINAKTLSPKIQQERELALQNEQQAILKYEQEVIQKVNVKRDELLKPIVEKVQAAIKAIGKENGYAMIFDTSTFNAILFVEDSDDVMPLVKAKLGI